MFERFTDRARRVVVLAQEEARMLNHNYIGTEHILLGLIHEGEGVAAKALESLGISLEGVRAQVEEIIGQGQQAPSGHIPFTPRAKKVLELSLREALQLGHNYIGTEHILLGLIREGEGVAAQVLVKLGADLNRVRQQVIQLLSGYQGKEAVQTGGPAEGTPSTSLVLDQFGRNLTQAAREGKLDPVIGRENEIERVMQVLSRRTKNNPVLIGEPGVGNYGPATMPKQLAIIEGHIKDAIAKGGRVLMGGVVYLPIEVSRVGPTLGQPGKRTHLDLTLGVDSDNDGIPDAWERALIERDSSGRLRTLADIKPGDDLDGDGLTNLQEYLIGTYALDRLDGLALEVLAVENGRARLRFTTVPGRTYTVKSSTNLNEWSPQAFALTAAGDGNQLTFAGQSVTLVEVWAPLPVGGTAFFKLYAE